VEDQITLFETENMLSSEFSQDALDTIISNTSCFITYMGAKTQARSTIFSCYPEDMTEIVSPFIGGGSFELYAASRGIRVYAHDKYDLLVKLWDIMLTRAHDVSKLVYEKFPMDPDYLNHLVISGEIYNIKDDLDFASTAICISKQGFNGFFIGHTYFRDSKYPKYIYKRDPEKPYMVGSKGDRIPNPDYEIKFEKGTLMRPQDWKNWRVPNLSVIEQDWQVTLKQYHNQLMYCDPPYAEEKQQRYYGPYRTKRGTPELIREWTFDHHGFAEAMKNHNNGWALSYLDHPLIRELYADYDVLFLEWAQGSLGSQMKHDCKSNKEILILKSPVSHPQAVKYADVPKFEGPSVIHRDIMQLSMEI